jgi:cytochrome b6-f complex iron-sulfur subunit
MLASRPDRREVLRTAFKWLSRLGFALLGLSGAMWTYATGRFLFPTVLAEPPERFPAGAVADYPPGHVETRYRDRYGVWIVHQSYQGRPQIFALRAACTHLGCLTVWQEEQQKFKCPCHGSGFSPQGIPCEGPAPRPLERLAIRLAGDGRLEVDRSQTFHEELGQWSDPASFVVSGEW